MPSGLRSRDLGGPTTPASIRPGLMLRSVRRSDLDTLAQLYLDGYGPGVAVADLAEATAEIAATFDGEFGVLRTDVSLLAAFDGVPAGAILITERSIWDERLDGPFVIDLFVVPAARGRGAGAALLATALDRCRQSGSGTLSLRVGDGTSDAAHRLYARFGFVEVGA